MVVGTGRLVVARLKRGGVGSFLMDIVLHRVIGSYVRRRTGRGGLAAAVLREAVHQRLEMLLSTLDLASVLWAGLLNAGRALNAVSSEAGRSKDCKTVSVVERR